MSFEDEITHLFAEHEGAQTTRSKAKDLEEQDRQAFLRAFRDKFSNLITPILLSVTKHPAAARSLYKFTIEQLEDGYGGFLKIETGKDKESRLTFRADLKRRSVLVAKKDTPHRVIALEELTEELVQEEVRTFLREALQKSLGS
ncbi:MAG TPA: hypothetical protein VMW27_03600 [Thermoanaerobaculia bacterium]|nr:hypothetical protein [Thermoanaerobaculia bacterium]